MFQKIPRIIALASLILFASSFAQAKEDAWLVNFDKAKEIAAKEKKDILMDFTGSDWCGYCIKLHDNVFSKEAFNQEIPKHFVLLKLDYPKDKSKQTKEEIAQNEKLQEKYKVSGFPTIFLADSQGRPYSQTVGYEGETAEDYTKKLLDGKAIREKRDGFFDKAKSAEGLEKAKLLDQAVSLFEMELALSIYRDEIDQIISLDQDNKGQLKSKYENVLKLQDVKKRINDIVSKNQNDVKTCLDEINKLYDELKPTGVLAVEILYSRSFFKYQQKDMDGARSDLEAAIKADPDSPRAAELKDIIDRIFNKTSEENTVQNEEKTEK